MSSAETAAAPRARFASRSPTGAARVEPNRWVVTLLTALWMSLFLLPDQGWSWVAIPVCALGMLVLPERPIITVGIVLAAHVFLTLRGAGYGEIELLLPTLASLHWLGRARRPAWVGLVAVAAITAATVQRAESWLGAAISAGLVYGFAWAFGLLIRRRATAASEAVRAAELAAALDIEMLAGDAADGERRRVTQGVIERLRAAIEGIACAATDARAQPTADALTAIARAADHAIARLHEELGALARETAGDDAPADWWRRSTLVRGATDVRASSARASLLVRAPDAPTTTDLADAAKHVDAPATGMPTATDDTAHSTSASAPAPVPASASASAPASAPTSASASASASTSTSTSPDGSVPQWRARLTSLIAAFQSPVALVVARAAGAALGSALMLVATHAIGGEWTRPAFLIPALLLPLAIWICRAMPLAAGVLAAVAFVTAAIDMPHPAGALLPGGAAYFLLCWRFTCDLDVGRHWRAQWRSLAGIIATCAAALALAVQHGRESSGFIVLMTILAISGAYAWGERDRVTHREEARAAQLVARAATAQVEATTNERRRFAHELHDIVSHALVGVSLQAQVATRAPTADRREALDTIAAVTALATDELGALVARVEHRAIDVSLVDLVERGRVLGLEVSAEFDEPSVRDPLAFRILREGLTNAARYAPGSEVGMRAVEHEGYREVVIANGPSRAPSSLQHRAGRGTGLRGLADAVEARNGEFEARRTASGFLIATRYPARYAPSMAPGRPTSPPRHHPEEDA